MPVFCFEKFSLKKGLNWGGGWNLLWVKVAEPLFAGSSDPLPPEGAHFARVDPPVGGSPRVNLNNHDKQPNPPLTQTFSDHYCNPYTDQTLSKQTKSSCNPSFSLLGAMAVAV